MVHTIGPASVLWMGRVWRMPLWQTSQGQTAQTASSGGRAPTGHRHTLAPDTPAVQGVGPWASCLQNCCFGYRVTPGTRAGTDLRGRVPPTEPPTRAIAAPAAQENAVPWREPGHGPKQIVCHKFELENKRTRSHWNEVKR